MTSYLEVGHLTTGRCLGVLARIQYSYFIFHDFLLEETYKCTLLVWQSSRRG